MWIARWIILFHLADVFHFPEVLAMGHSCHLKLDLSENILGQAVTLK